MHPDKLSATKPSQSTDRSLTLDFPDIIDSCSCGYTPDLPAWL